MSLFFQNQAEEDFNKARNKALINEIQNFLFPDKRKLLSFNDVKKVLRPKNEVYAGMQVVPIVKIAGSEGRYQDFDNHFLPRTNMLKSRWARVDEAHLNDIVLPPIQLYEIGGLYFVRDGNHRVSVAKMQGVEYIDAEVISLKSEIKLKPHVTAQTLRSEVVKYEKRIFYTNTQFGDLTEDWHLDFTSPGQYDVIYNHILGHKYFINEGVSGEIPFGDALISWYEKVYKPIIHVIAKYRLLKRFRKRTRSDLYVWIVKQWDDLKTKYGDDISLDEATKQLTDPERSAGPGFLRRLFNRNDQT